MGIRFCFSISLRDSQPFSLCDRPRHGIPPYFADPAVSTMKFKNVSTDQQFEPVHRPGIAEVTMLIAPLRCPTATTTTTSHSRTTSSAAWLFPSSLRACQPVHPLYILYVCTCTDVQSRPESPVSPTHRHCVRDLHARAIAHGRLPICQLCGT